MLTELQWLFFIQVFLQYDCVLTAGVPLAYLQGGVPLTGSHILGGFKAAEDNLAEISASDALAYMRSVRETFACYEPASADRKQELVTANAFVHGEDGGACQVVQSGSDEEYAACADQMESCKWFRHSPFPNGQNGDFGWKAPFQEATEGWWDHYCRFLVCLDSEKGIITVFAGTGNS